MWDGRIKDEGVGWRWQRGEERSRRTKRPLPARWRREHTAQRRQCGLVQPLPFVSIAASFPEGSVDLMPSGASNQRERVRGAWMPAFLFHMRAGCGSNMQYSSKQQGLKRTAPAFCHQLVRQTTDRVLTAAQSSQQVHER